VLNVAYKKKNIPPPLFRKLILKVTTSDTKNYMKFRDHTKNMDHMPKNLAEDYLSSNTSSLSLSLSLPLTISSSNSDSYLGTEDIIQKNAELREMIREFMLRVRSIDRTKCKEAESLEAMNQEIKEFRHRFFDFIMEKGVSEAISTAPENHGQLEQTVEQLEGQKIKLREDIATQQKIAEETTSLLDRFNRENTNHMETRKALEEQVCVLQNQKLELHLEIKGKENDFIENESDHKKKEEHELQDLEKAYDEKLEQKLSWYKQAAGKFSQQLKDMSDKVQGCAVDGRNLHSEAQKGYAQSEESFKDIIHLVLQRAKGVENVRKEQLDQLDVLKFQKEVELEEIQKTRIDEEAKWKKMQEKEQEELQSLLNRRDYDLHVSDERMKDLYNSRRTNDWEFEEFQAESQEKIDACRRHISSNIQSTVRVTTENEKHRTKFSKSRQLLDSFNEKIYDLEKQLDSQKIALESHRTLNKHLVEELENGIHEKNKKLSDALEPIMSLYSKKIEDETNEATAERQRLRTYTDEVSAKSLELDVKIDNMSKILDDGKALRSRMAQTSDNARNEKEFAQKLEEEAKLAYESYKDTSKSQDIVLQAEARMAEEMMDQVKKAFDEENVKRNQAEGYYNAKLLELYTTHATLMNKTREATVELERTKNEDKELGNELVDLRKEVEKRKANFLGYSLGISRQIEDGGNQYRRDKKEMEDIMELERREAHKTEMNLKLEAEDYTAERLKMTENNLKKEEDAKLELQRLREALELEVKGYKKKIQFVNGKIELENNELQRITHHVKSLSGEKIAAQRISAFYKSEALAVTRQNDIKLDEEKSKLFAREKKDQARRTIEVLGRQPKQQLMQSISSNAHINTPPALTDSLARDFQPLSREKISRGEKVSLESFF